jgi:hypothetical protein
MDKGLKTPGLAYDPCHWAGLYHRHKGDLLVPQTVFSSAHTRVPSSTYSSLYLTSTIGPSLPKPNASHNWNSSSLSLPIPNHFLPPPLPGSSGASLRSNRHNTCASVSFNCKYARFLPLHCLVPILNGLKALRASRIDSGDVVGDSIQREGSNVNGLVK